MIAVRDHRQHLGDAHIAIVTFTGDPASATAYRRHLGLEEVGIPVLVDPDRALYRALGASRGSRRRVWSPGTLVLYARLIRRGRRLRGSHDDTRQLGADLVVDRAGRVHRVWLPDGPDRRPPVGELIDTVAQLSDR